MLQSLFIPLNITTNFQFRRLFMKLSMKTRKIGYTYGSSSGYFPFRKEKSIHYESPLEKDFLKLMEFKEDVLSVEGQPLTLEYLNSNGTQVRYTPDFLVHFDTEHIKPILVEVKPYDKLKKEWETYKERFKIAVKFAYSNGMLFRIYDERRIRSSFLKNVMQLKRYQHVSLSNEDENRVLKFIEASGKISIERILEDLYDSEDEKAIGKSLIFNLIFRKKLRVNLDRLLDNQSAIWLNNITANQGYVND